MILKISITIFLFSVFTITMAQKKLPEHDVNSSRTNFSYLNQMRTGMDESRKVWSVYTNKKHIENHSIQTIKFQLDSTIIMKFDGNFQLWRNRKKYNYYYTDNFRLDAESNYNWQKEESSWSIEDSSKISYNSSGMLSEDTDYWIFGSGDSLTPRRMATYIYNDKDLKTEENYFEWFLDEERWRQILKYEWQYNESGDLILADFFALYDEDNDLDLIRSEEFEYDNNGNQILKLIHTYNSERTILQPSLKILDEYTVFGIVKLHQEFSFHRDIEEWVEVSRFEREINNEGQISEHISYITHASELIPHRKKNYDYFANDGRLKEELNMDWDRDSLEWINSTWNVYAYDNNTHQFTHYWWNIYENAIDWSPYFREIIYFNEDGQISYGVLYNWRESSEVWEEDEKIEFAYDHEGNMTLELQLEKDNYNNVWDSLYKDAYLFSYKAELSELLLPLSLEELPDYYSGMLTENTVYEWNDNVNNWEGTYLYKFNYSELKFNNDPLSVVSSLSVYPNPAKHFIKIDLEDVSPVVVDLYSIEGKKMLSVLSYSGDQIAVDFLKSGIYIYHIRMKKNLYTGKLLIR